MSLDTACFSMYSDISKRIKARSEPKRNSANDRATSVLPTPVGPKKRNEPTGRLGFFSPARLRRMARDKVEIALGVCALVVLRGATQFALALMYLCGQVRLAQLHACAGLINDVNRFVRQETIRDVTLRLIDRRLHRIRRIANLMERLVALLDAFENLNSFFFSRRRHF